MSHTDKLNQGVGRRNLSGVGLAAQSVTRNRLAPGWKFAFGSSANQSPHVMPAFDQVRDEGAAEISGAPCDKYRMLLCAHEFPKICHAHNSLYAGKPRTDFQ